ncbi:hypothetical protein HMPREF1049_0378 [Fusobacterium necrophorum subsp. funduliforme ATCC 51357]|uniref:Uncharacterized protein n=1 Tax=Fusobacterium necrophorum subsp. funduliforme Fnf 1007 TaxID=1161424 RepID=A0AAN3VX22_9FUSO|nr:hypothetical protein [Fusobacterium necrophorum]EIJ68851.1 hypothetical protein HMPREF1049_0378 [Fusobacterium necrophorum subsp. funduliforme ATCC 51357]EJU18586.1 hypothetical protein HMPREF1127_1334 [Fusobacterium necrophorum subsp. funduliforme Fnf 1007]
MEKIRKKCYDNKKVEKGEKNDGAHSENDIDFIEIYLDYEP